MQPRIAQLVAGLAALCQLSTEEDRNGWVVDRWELTPGDRDALRQAYADSLIPPLTDPAVQALVADGVPVAELFLNVAGADPLITRADMAELAAAATILSRPGIDLAWTHMPNFPKGSRAQSAPGIDIVCAALHVGASETTLQPGERVTICSVKHKTDDQVEDLLGNLVRSISSKTLNVSYLAQQLRVLEGMLDTAGLQGRRVYLVLKGSCPAAAKELIAVGAVDTQYVGALWDRLQLLRRSQAATRRFRVVGVEDISTLHDGFA